MKKIIPSIITILFLALSLQVKAQDEDRKSLMGKVIYRSVNVPNENVINVTSEGYTTTNEDGEFAIDVKVGDLLVFTSLNYNLASIEITKAIIEKGRLVVEVIEKVNQLDEVVVSPENQEKFLNHQSEELGAYGKYSYERDDATEIENPSLPTQVNGLQNGLNVGNLVKLLFKKKEKEATDKEDAPKLKLSEILLQVYNQEFFVIDLKIPQDKVNEFVFWLDTQPFSRDLLKKDNEFQFVDYLVNKSKEFKKLLTEEKKDNKSKK